MGSTEDPLDGKAVAATAFTSVAVYAVSHFLFIVNSQHTRTHQKAEIAGLTSLSWLEITRYRGAALKDDC